VRSIAVLQPTQQQARQISSQTSQDERGQSLDQEDFDAATSDADVDSEIYERAVRFVNEISSEESGSDIFTTTADKDDKSPTMDLVWPFPNKESSLSSISTCGFGPTWNPTNPQEEWTLETNEHDMWQLSPGSNYWGMKSFDRIA